MTAENVEHRALAAIRFLDEETKLIVRGPVRLECDGMRFVRNFRDLHVILDAPGFEDYADHLDLPAQRTPPVAGPAPAQFTITATDPTRTYLPRRFTVDLPRDPTPGPDEGLPANSVFLPVDVVLYPSATARPSTGSAAVRLGVQDKNGKPLAGALVELALASPSIVRRGLSDDRGEALIPIPGVPIANWASPDATVDFDVTVKAAWAPGAPPPNPDALAGSLQAIAGTIQVASGTEIFKTIQLTWIEL